MDIYFVRHAETAANARKRFQAPNEPITDKGSRDVAKLVHIIERLEPTHLYTSPYKRARQTADYLSYATSKEARWLELVHELEYPEYMLGKRHYSLATAWYGLRWFFNAKSVTVGVVAETRTHFFTRLMATRTFFANHHALEDKIVVVSHSFFINGFVMHLCKNRPMRLWETIPHAFRVLRAKNTGVTHVRYTSENGNGRWQLISLDEGTHLED